MIARLLLLAVLGAAGCATRRPVTLCAHLAGGNGFPADAQDSIHNGDAVLRLEKTAIAFSIVAPGLETVTATHIHHGPSGTAGPMLWEINTGYKGDSLRGTASEIPPGVITLIASEPGEYYVKLHTVKFPGGAIRGQLGPCPSRGK
ncbi:MAG TPA: CHRD domain-containing protein [Thermoanaerobaculia bacterium]|nr:CHRD domain-containing protein [Thermoanaerobaculia bacterium]